MVEAQHAGSRDGAGPRGAAQGRGCTRTTAASLQQSLSGDTSSRGPSFLWGFITLLVGSIWWWFYRRWRHPATWVAGVVPFLIVLFVFYVYFERLLPANF